MGDNNNASSSDIVLTEEEEKMIASLPDEMGRQIKETLLQAKQEIIKAEQEKIKAEQEKTKAEQEKIKAEQEKTKAEQEKIKAEQEKTKAEQEKIKAEQEKTKAEQEKIKAEQEKMEGKKMASGEFWTPLDVLYKTSETSFAGGFSAICGRIGNESWKRPNAYKYIVEDLTNISKDKNIKAIDLSLQTSKASGSLANDSNNSNGSNNNSNGSTKGSNKGKGGAVKKDRLANYQQNTPMIKRDFMGYPDGDDAHLFPKRSTSCIPRYGILSQLVVGCNFEDLFDTKKTKDKQKLIKILQLAVLSPNNPKGLSSLKYNLFTIPKSGHLTHFDNGCRWFFVPVMTLEEVLQWREGAGYTIMVIAGNMQGDDNNPNEEGRFYTNAEVYASLLKADVLEKRDHRLLEESDVQKATGLLTAIIKGLADMVTGRGEGKLTPKLLGRDKDYDDLELDQAHALVNGEEKLKSSNKVTVPVLEWKRETHVVGVEIGNSTTDPLLLAIKSANNWMAQNGEKAVPGCEDRSGDDTSSSERDDDEFVAPSSPKVPDFIQFKTPVVTP